MTQQTLTPLIGMDMQQMVQLCHNAEVKPIHAEHITAALFRNYNSDLDAITELPNRLREYLRQHTSTFEPECTAMQQAEDGTRKLLLKMSDGKEVETVLIQGPGRLTQCISTQVGCAVGCTFCLTATAGLSRNLSSAEMAAQVIAGQKTGRYQVRNLVLMGMGEPLHNYNEVARFVRIAAEPKGMAFSPNRITLSTSGMVPGIYKMIEDELPCNLAISLNATTNAVRDQVIPINRKYPIETVLTAVRDYIQARGNKRVLIEYVLLSGINDSIDDASRLCELVADLGCTVNLLPFNAYPGSLYMSPASQSVNAFRAVLVEAGIIAVVRESRGRDISAACGQLKTEVAQRRRESST